MWICAECNEVVEHPLKGQKCPQGHALFDSRILMPTKETSFGNAVLIGFLTATAGAVVFALLARYVAKSFFTGADGLFVLIALPFLALLALMRGLKWRKQGGAASRLAPRAFGTATGWLLFAAIIGIAALIVSR